MAEESIQKLTGYFFTLQYVMPLHVLSRRKRHLSRRGDVHVRVLRLRRFLQVFGREQVHLHACICRCCMFQMLPVLRLLRTRLVFVTEFHSGKLSLQLELGCYIICG